MDDPDPWERVLAIWARPELFVEDLFRTFQARYDTLSLDWRIDDPVFPLKMVELVTDGYPVRRE